MSEENQAFGGPDEESDKNINTRFYDDIDRVHNKPRCECLIDSEDEAYREKTPLLLNGSTSTRSLTPSSGTVGGLYTCLSRSNSVPSVSGATGSSSDVSESKLSSSQKRTLVITAIADLLAFLSLSIMAPFFPEEVIVPFLSYPIDFNY